MRKSILLPAFFLMSMLFMATKCEENNDTIESDRLKLSELKTEIDTLVEASVCGDAYSCAFIAYGSKACGGPQGYLVYTNSIDVENLKVLIENYNEAEAYFNKKWDIVSNCMMPSPPTNLICENNKCVAVF